ncbi:hypothetical protein BHM03_00049568 [Ensete ventricosum]|nr:hypothetical protein BHM03_00049568 [Ensete ventricosum]
MDERSLASSPNSTTEAAAEEQRSKRQHLSKGEGETNVRSYKIVEMSERGFTGAMGGAVRSAVVIGRDGEKTGGRTAAVVRREETTEHGFPMSSDRTPSLTSPLSPIARFGGQRKIWIAS